MTDTTGYQPASDEWKLAWEAGYTAAIRGDFHDPGEHDPSPYDWGYAAGQRAAHGL